MNTRNAAVEGRFYPSTKDGILKQIQEIENAGKYALSQLSPVRIFGVVLPHAGHLYSGYQTIPFFKLINSLKMVPETFVIVHPNHSGHGLPLAVDDADVWHNSIGDVPVDREFASALSLPFDSKAHAREHSAEVIIPYMQYYFRDHSFFIVPICMMDQAYGNSALVAERIREAIRLTGRKIMVLASCDFSHFLPPELGKQRDQLVLEHILSRNAKRVEMAVKENHVSVCGYGPIMALMEYAGGLNPEYKMKILARGHSGEVIPSHEVVDYISMIMYQ